MTLVLQIVWKSLLATPTYPVGLPRFLGLLEFPALASGVRVLYCSWCERPLPTKRDFSVALSFAPQFTTFTASARRGWSCGGLLRRSFTLDLFR